MTFEASAHSQVVVDVAAVVRAGARGSGAWQTELRAFGGRDNIHRRAINNYYFSSTR